MTNTVVYTRYTRDLLEGKSGATNDLSEIQSHVLRDIENFKVWPKLKELDVF